MHVIDIIDPTNPSLLFIHEFTKGEGVPRSIDVCGNEIAVALAAQTDVNEGHTRFYRTYTRGSGATDITQDGTVTGIHLINRVCRESFMFSKLWIDRKQHIEGREQKSSECFFTYIHLDLFRSYSSMYVHMMIVLTTIRLI